MQYTKEAILKKFDEKLEDWYFGATDYGDFVLNMDDCNPETLEKIKDFLCSQIEGVLSEVVPEKWEKGEWDTEGAAHNSSIDEMVEKAKTMGFNI